ncbi:MAG: cyclic nucleotide-binding domain-containing protein [Planctomycetaceae bacterium]
MSDHAPIRTLTTCPLFESMTPDELDAVFRLMKSEAFPAGGEILTEGLTYQSLWVIVSGRCEVVKGTTVPRGNRLAVLETGAVFGEMSFLEAAPHSASVRAMSDVDTMRLTHAGFEQLRIACPSAADKIARSLIVILSARLRRMDEWTCGLVQNAGNERHHAEWHEFRAKLYGGLQI